MSIIVDLVIIGIIAICSLIGYIRGLTGSLIKILSFILSLIIAFILFVPVSNFVINNTQIDENIEKSIREVIISDEKETEQEEKMPKAITDYINQKLENTVDNAKEGIANSTAKEVSVTIVKAGTWIALFLLARIILILLKFITGLISRLPIIKQFDKIGGILYGFIEGLVITYIALALISFISPITNSQLSEDINNSQVGSKMYNNNILLNIIF